MYYILRQYRFSRCIHT